MERLLWSGEYKLEIDTGENKIDFVITWVDGQDPQWQEEKIKYQDKSSSEYAVGEARYRDWDLLKYWFRGVEENAPWVNKIHFVTWGHVPSWLNTKHPKLNIVYHTDFIPNKFLPTFSSHVIELNLHRINSLQEAFVYFNDDMFVIDKVQEEAFFINNKPCDEALFHNIISHSYNKDYAHYQVNEAGLINDNFNFQHQIKKFPDKFFSEKYLDLVEINKIYAKQKFFPGFYIHHLPQPHLKSTFYKVWDINSRILEATCCNKFRNIKDVSHSIFRFWNIMDGNFEPAYYRKKGRSFSLDNDINIIKKFIEDKERKFICLNDNDNIYSFLDIKRQIHQSFKQIFPTKCNFEL